MRHIYLIFYIFVWERYIFDLFSVLILDNEEMFNISVQKMPIEILKTVLKVMSWWLFLASISLLSACHNANSVTGSCLGYKNKAPLQPEEKCSSSPKSCWVECKTFQYWLSKLKACENQTWKELVYERRKTIGMLVQISRLLENGLIHCPFSRQLYKKF